MSPSENPPITRKPKVIMLGRINRFDDPEVLPEVLSDVPEDLKVLRTVEESRVALAEWWEDTTGTIPQPIFIIA